MFSPVTVVSWLVGWLVYQQDWKQNLLNGFQRNFNGGWIQGI